MILAALGQAVPATRPGRDAAAIEKLYGMGAADFFKLPEVQGRIRKDSVDLVLLEVAVFQQTNRERAVHNLPALKHSWAMQLMARQHSDEMVKLQYFEHESPAAGNRTLADRLKNVGLVNVTAGENIAVLPAKEMGSGTYIVKEGPDGGELLIDEVTRKPIDYYAYEGLAKAALEQWMNSPSHRKNILDKRFVFLGVGGARGPYDKGQDSIYLTQNFTATVNAGESKARGTLVPEAK